MLYNPNPSNAEIPVSLETRRLQSPSSQQGRSPSQDYCFKAVESCWATGREQTCQAGNCFTHSS